jgi:chorismate-pyruvate lyase
MNLQRSQVVAADFDPAAEVFVAQDSRPPALTPVAPHELTPFQRAVLVIDGTVTRFIEAYALEPVEIVRLDQSEAPLLQDDPWLVLAAGSPVIRRQVMLRGVTSGQCFVWAESLIVVARLSADMRADLQTDPGGLGRIMLDSGLETRREALWYGRERRTDLPAPVAAETAGDFLTRTYRVIANREPLMMITERFPYGQPVMTKVD